MCRLPAGAEPMIVAAALTDLLAWLLRRLVRRRRAAPPASRWRPVGAGFLERPLTPEDLRDEAPRRPRFAWLDRSAERGYRIDRGWRW
jgi:hypothetical protein